MSVEAALHAILANDTAVTGVVSSRVYPGRAPQSASLPFITYSRLSSVHMQVLSGSAGLDRALFQIDAWSTSYDTARELSEKIRLAIQGYSGTVASTEIDSISMQEDRDQYFPPTKADELGIHSAETDYYIWHAETVPTFT